MVNKYYLIA
uniref:Uncharacterized protein n=1 Tax=Talaromyces marneffei PM1 TaxID=1077442 RepID=A0A093V4A5_TALMA